LVSLEQVSLTSKLQMFILYDFDIAWKKSFSHQNYIKIIVFFFNIILYWICQ
jgi:hypothetical protein